MEKIRKKRSLNWLGGAACFAAILWLMLLTPLTGDDWCFLSLHTTNPGALAARIAEQWHNLNGRVIGNICAILFSGLDFPRELCKAAVVFFTVLLMNRLIFRRLPAPAGQVWTGLLIGAAVYMMPKEMYRQTFNWMAGFFNYVPVMLLILLYLWLIRGFLEGGSIPNTPFSVLGAAVLGVCSQLFVENLTIYAVILSFAVLVWYWFSRRKLNLTLAVYAAGAVCGALIMFRSPVYGRISADEDGYRTMNLGLTGMLRIMGENYETVIQYTFRSCLPQLAVMAALACVLLARNRRMHPWARYLLMGAVCAGPVYGWATEEVLAQPRNSAWDSALWLDLAVWVLFGAALLLTLLTSVQDLYRRRLGLVLLWSVPLSAGPLLFVQPIGPRCFYLTYLCEIGVLFLLLAEAVNWEETDRAKTGLIRFAGVFLAGAGLLFYLQISLPNHETYQTRVESAREQVQAGKTEVVLPVYPYPDFVHDTDPQKMDYIYRGITFREE